LADYRWLRRLRHDAVDLDRDEVQVLGLSYDEEARKVLAD
jgi:ABC-type enterochelin transport system permease subunit